MKFSSLSLRARLVAGFAVVTVIGVTATAWMARELWTQSVHTDELVSQRMLKIDQFVQLRVHQDEIALRARNIALDPSPAALERERTRIDRLVRDNAALLEELSHSVVLPEGKALLATVREASADYDRGLRKAVDDAGRGRSAEAADMLNGPLLALRERITRALEDSVSMQRRIARDLAAAQAAAARRDAALAGLAALLMAAAGGVIAWQATRTVRRQLGAEPAVLGAATKQVASGDLRPVPGAAEAPAGSVLALLGVMQQQLSALVRQVQQSAGSIATGSTQIATGSVDLSQRTEEQAANLQQTAASMATLHATVQSSAERAREASELARAADTATRRSGDSVDQVVRTMDDINERSRRIADIVGVIDSIAFQTNILALNAAVEAARAGEQGRGFAVVASEVRLLAGRSGEAAREIRTLIAASAETVDTGARLAHGAGDAMRAARDQVQRMTGLIHEISTAAGAQTSGIGQVNGAVSELDRVTQQNAALVEQSTAAAESLRGQAAQLQQMVAAFQLDTARA